jgi:hypothetical protein
MAVFIGGIKVGSTRGIPVISIAEFKKLKSIENAARNYGNTLKGNWYISKIMIRYQLKWEDYAESLGIYNGRYARFMVENGLDYSHGYYFWDAMA